MYYSYTVGRALARYKRTPYISINFHKMIYLLLLYHSHHICVNISIFQYSNHNPPNLDTLCCYR